MSSYPWRAARRPKRPRAAATSATAPCPKRRWGARGGATTTSRACGASGRSGRGEPERREVRRATMSGRK
eukprot:3027277-Alexandrium_andersonii.AAC.1